MAWYETLRDSLSTRIFDRSRDLARFDWTPEEASAWMRLISDEVKAECGALVSLPAWTPALAEMGSGFGH
jgi:hypothetical protein